MENLRRSLLSLPPPLNLEPPDIPVGVPSQLLERRPDIAASERRVAEANEGIGIARAAYFPSLVLGATGGLEGNSIANWFAWPSRFWAVGPSMLQTIFDGGRRRATSEGALANYDATVANYRETTLTAFQQVEDNLAALRILEHEAQQQREAVAEAKREFRSLRIDTSPGRPLPSGCFRSDHCTPERAERSRYLATSYGCQRSPDQRSGRWLGRFQATSDQLHALSAVLRSSTVRSHPTRPLGAGMGGRGGGWGRSGKGGGREGGAQEATRFSQGDYEPSDYLRERISGERFLDEFKNSIGFGATGR